MRPHLLFKAPVATASGYGVHARQLLKSLIASDLYDIRVKSLSWGQTPFLSENEDELISLINELSRKYENDVRNNSTKYDISVQVTIPNEFEKLADINVGVTAGIEVDVASPEWILKINQMVDILFVPSVHSRDVLLKSIFYDNNGKELSINKMPIVVQESFNHNYFNTDLLQQSEYNDDFKIEPEFNFLFVGLGLDKGYGEDRKNVANLIKWFCESFKDRKDVGLVLKLSIVNNSLMDYERVVKSVKEIKKQSGAGEFPKISIIHGRLSDAKLAALYKHPKIKAFISLTHGEGYGLPLLEAAACGLPVIATNWSGHLDFLKLENQKSFVELEYDMTEVPNSAVWNGVIEKGSKWASVKEEDVKLKMKKVVASYDKPKEWASNLSEVIHNNFNEHVIGFRFVSELDSAIKLHLASHPRTKEEAVELLKKQIFDESDTSKTLLYTMPMSAGDVYISTAVVDSLKKKYPDHKIFFATNEQYKSILENNNDIHKIIQYQDWMMDISLCESVFDVVFTPNVNIQMTFSNWIKGGNGRRLADEMANHCLVELGEYKIQEVKPNSELPQKYITFHPGSGKGQWEARNYLHWQDIVTNVKNITGLDVVQIGTDDEPLYNDILDFRSKTKDYRELAFVIKNATAHIGIDSVSMHLAAGLGTPHLALFGSSYANSTGPSKSKSLSVLVETPTRYTCDKACYKYQCSVDRENPCINEIEPKSVVEKILSMLSLENDKISLYKEVSPKISGYTHVFNPESGGYPYIESIKSMLGFCDEVIVIDGGSTDGSTEKINSINDSRIKVIERKWDWDEPGMDGMQKAFGRAMCSGDFLWQMDVDEVVHESDYSKIKKLVKKFPKNVSLIHLPVIELWGDENTVRTDRHSWKWRLSRNDFRITHGIAKHARMFDEKTGKVFAKKGQSDGCEFIDLMTHEYIQHAGFYSRELDILRVENPNEYGSLMNGIFNDLPTVYHYSWADLKRKVANFKQFWNECWNNLYRDSKPEDRFPDVFDEESLNKKVEELKEQGGEHTKSPTFKLNKSNPKVMEEWISKIQ